RRPAGEVVDRDFLRVDAEMIVDRGEEILRRTVAFDDGFAAFVALADDAAGLNSAAGPQIRKRVRPVFAAGLCTAGGAAGAAGSVSNWSSAPISPAASMLRSRRSRFFRSATRPLNRAIVSLSDKPMFGTVKSGRFGSPSTASGE